MLKKALAPLFLTSIFVIAGCSSDEASKDLENVEDIELNEEDKQSSENGSSENTTNNENEGNTSGGGSSDQSINENQGEDESSNSDLTNSDSQQNSNSSEENKNTEDKESTQSSGGSKEDEGSQSSDASNTNDSKESSSKQTYTLSEVNGEAVNVLQGLNAVEIKRADISGATANTTVILEAGDKKISLTYNKKRDSFRNYQIKQVELDKLKKANVIVKG